jgi:hypothetical protein
MSGFGAASAILGVSSIGATLKTSPGIVKLSVVLVHEKRDDRGFEKCQNATV